VKSEISLHTGRLASPVWNNPAFSIKVKTKLYCPCILSVLLYCNEAWCTYRCHKRELTTFYFRCLCSSLASHEKMGFETSPSCILQVIPTLSPLWHFVIYVWHDGVRKGIRAPAEGHCVWSVEVSWCSTQARQTKIRYKDIIAKRHSAGVSIPLQSWETIFAYRETRHDVLGKDFQNSIKIYTS